MGQNNFGSGFIVGSVFGGVVGGVLGALLVTKDNSHAAEKTQSNPIEAGSPPLDLSSEEGIEMARHSLEDKIAQLNYAIDEVRQQLDSVDNPTSSVD